MTAPVGTAQGGQKAPANQKGQKAQRPPRAFLAGTRAVDQNQYDITKTLTTSTQDLSPYEVVPDGFWRGGWLLVEATSSANAAAVAFQADGPMIVIDTIQVNDVNNKPILGPMTGHDLYECVKYGGYAFQDDAKMSPIYSVTTGAGGTGGSFTWAQWVPIEIARRDALGALPNKNSSSTFSINIRLSALATIYSVLPTNPPSVRVRFQQLGWMDPAPADMQGNPVSQNPPAVQTTQYWSKQTYTINAGAFTQRLQGIDSMLRTMLFELRDSSNSRSTGDADWPDPFNMTYETSQPLARIRNIWRHMIGEQYGYTAAVETAGGRDYGLYPLTYAYDFSDSPGNESRLSYLPVSSATNITPFGTIGGAGTHTLVVLVNKIVPAMGNPLALTGGR